MDEVNFESYYRQIFDTFGYPLPKSAAVSRSTLAKVEKSLGVVAPKALLDYYVVAGREKRFNDAHNQLLSCQGWEVHQKRLLFMAENQGVVFWSVSLGNPENSDPAVWQAGNEEPYEWYLENRKCSTFIAVMLHYQAVLGGMKFCANAPINPSLKRKLKNGWTSYGTDNGLTAYSRPNQVVCIEKEMGVLAAGKTKKDLDAIAVDLGLSWEYLGF